MTAGARVYLDHAATTPIRPAVAERIGELACSVGNPSSVHREGRAARKLLEESRDLLAATVGVVPDGVIFTSGGTEANDLALGVAGEGPMLAAATEHVSILEAAGPWPRVPVHPDGLLDLSALARLLAEVRPVLVSVMLVNNETGVVQDIPAIAKCCRAHGALLHVDAVQALGKLAVRLDLLQCDLLTVSAHKVGGPAGIGALVARNGLVVPPRLRGGGQEGWRRAGTQNLLGIIGFAQAIRSLDAAEPMRLERLRTRLEQEVARRCPSTRIVAQDVPRAPHIATLVTPGSRSDLQLIRLDLAGVAVSAGAACSSGKVAPSHVLAAMGLGEDAACAVRVSLGWTTTEADVARFVEVFSGMHRVGANRSVLGRLPLPFAPAIAK